MTKIIAFAGRKQSGKTTSCEFVANVFVGNFLGNVKIFNFADPLKNDICIKILGLNYDQCYGSDEHKNELVNCYWEGRQMSAREVMQFVGTDIFRKMQNNVWADATINRILNEKSKLDLALIADCRFPNEVESIKNAGGLVIKLQRNPFNSDHSSETALDDQNYDPRNFDLVIPNNSLSITEQNQIIYNFLIEKEILPL